MENEKLGMVAAWTVAEFKESIANASDQSYLILTSDYKLIVIDEEELAKIIKNNGPQ